MNTDKITVTNAGAGMDEALNQASAAAAYRGLSHKEALRLRLLAEEMLGMLREITREAEAQFWVESEGRKFELHLQAHPRLTIEMREELLSVSSSGRNAAATGVMGKLRDIFERAFSAGEVDPSSAYYMQGLLMPSSYEGMDPMSYSNNASMVIWSMQKLKRTVASEKDSSDEAMQEWDELEKSIVANLADEVSIAIRGSEVEMTVFKDFDK